MRVTDKGPSKLGIVLVAMLLTGCATPTEQLSDKARRAGLQQQTIAAGAFDLTAFSSTPEGTFDRLHVYLDSDGTPWRRGVWPAEDPTPRGSVVLELIQRDDHPSLYLSRPCYARTDTGDACTSSLWTDERYSQTVVDALSAGLDTVKSRHRAEAFVLIGHSGGGALAMLLAAVRDDVAGVVTLGANLDHRLWAQRKGYKPLSGSLNAAEQPPLPATVLRWHLVGGEDRVVPPDVTRKAARRDPHAVVQRYPEFDHHCCWAQIWPKVLGRLDRALDEDPPRHVRPPQMDADLTE